MDYNGRKLVPYIPPAEYDKVAHEFLEPFYPDALKNPMRKLQKRDWGWMSSTFVFRRNLTFTE